MRRRYQDIAITLDLPSPSITLSPHRSHPSYIADEIAGAETAAHRLYNQTHNSYPTFPLVRLEAGGILDILYWCTFDSPYAQAVPQNQAEAAGRIHGLPRGLDED